jgi:hypothetical protein
VNEEELFNWLVENHYPDLVKAKSPISRWDCFSPEYYHRIELKCRSKHFDALLIEKKKFDALILKCNDNFDVPMYINSTPEGVYRFNLYYVKPVWKKQQFRATTQFSNRRWVEKEIAMLDVNDAEIL